MEVNRTLRFVLRPPLALHPSSIVRLLFDAKRRRWCWRVCGRDTFLPHGRVLDPKPGPRGSESFSTSRPVPRLPAAIFTMRRPQFPSCRAGLVGSVQNENVALSFLKYLFTTRWFITQSSYDTFSFFFCLFFSCNFHVTHVFTHLPQLFISVSPLILFSLFVCLPFCWYLSNQTSNQSPCM